MRLILQIYSKMACLAKHLPGYIGSTKKRQSSFDVVSQNLLTFAFLLSVTNQICQLNKITDNTYSSDQPTTLQMMMQISH
jgi:hypothetical protein